MLSFFFSQPALNDKTANPEVARLMKELIKSRKQLKGKLNKTLKISKFKYNNIMHSILMQKHVDSCRK